MTRAAPQSAAPRLCGSWRTNPPEEESPGRGPPSPPSPSSTWLCGCCPDAMASETAPTHANTHKPRQSINKKSPELRMHPEGQEATQTRARARTNPQPERARPIAHAHARTRAHAANSPPATQCAHACAHTTHLHVNQRQDASTSAPGRHVKASGCRRDLGTFPPPPEAVFSTARGVAHGGFATARARAVSNRWRRRRRRHRWRRKRRRPRPRGRGGDVGDVPRAPDLELVPGAAAPESFVSDTDMPRRSRRRDAATPWVQERGREENPNKGHSM